MGTFLALSSSPRLFVVSALAVVLSVLVHVLSSVTDEDLRGVWILKIPHKGSVDHFDDFWIQKSHHCYDFWIQKKSHPFLQFLDPEIAPFLRFLDPEIRLVHFCNFWIQKLQHFNNLWIQK